jgi:hypothetical protein
MEYMETLRIQYHYWREFLLRSKKYAIVCEAIREMKENVGCPEQFKNWTINNGEMNAGYIEWAMNNNVNTKVMRLSTQRGVQFSSQLIISIYPLFQDIYLNDFDDVWHRVETYYTDTSHPKTIYDGVGAVAELFGYVEHSLYATLKHEPSLAEFKEEYFAALSRFDQSRRLLSVAPFGYPKNKIVADFREELSRLFVRVGADKPSRLVQFPWAIYEPTGPIIPEQLDVYLKAFDAKESAASPREALLQMYPTLDFGTSENFEDCERSFRRHCAKAKRLIQNAETANFPGKITKSQ